MPWSSGHGIKALTEWINEHGIATVLDVGAGAGRYGVAIRNACPSVTVLDAIEVFPYYQTRFSLDDIYDTVTIADARTITSFPYDLVVLGDVIEHMPRADAVALWAAISASARFAYIAMPIGLCEQTGSNVPDDDTETCMMNPYEEHVEPEASTEEIVRLFPGIFRFNIYDLVNVNHNPTFQIGCFYASFSAILQPGRGDPVIEKILSGG
jgi:hypothetical protein